MKTILETSTVTALSAIEKNHYKPVHTLLMSFLNVINLGTVSVKLKRSIVKGVQVRTQDLKY